MYVHEIVGVKEPSQAPEVRVACPSQPHRAPETRAKGARDNLDTATPIMEGEAAPPPRGERGHLACEGRVHQCARAGSVLPDPGGRFLRSTRSRGDVTLPRRESESDDDRDCDWLASGISRGRPSLRSSLASRSRLCSRRVSTVASSSKRTACRLGCCPRRHISIHSTRPYVVGTPCGVLSGDSQ